MRVNTSITIKLSSITCKGLFTRRTICEAGRCPADSGAKTAQEKAYDTRYSQAVTHPSTNRARRCLTSVIGRELVYSTWYGRKRLFFSAISSRISHLAPLREFAAVNEKPENAFLSNGRVKKLIASFDLE